MELLDARRSRVGSFEAVVSGFGDGTVRFVKRLGDA
jgi:hypothetical protein